MKVLDYILDICQLLSIYIEIVFSEDNGCDISYRQNTIKIAKGFKKNLSN